ncbi:MAG: Peptidase [Rhodocyclales bacterium]|nr:Peptidase [Rhodocyclales bacterium]
MNDCMIYPRLISHPLHRFYFCLPAVVAALVLTACISSRPAPVETRDTSRSTATANAPAVARPGYYIVKKGDTLYSIALENGHDYHEIATWNGIDNPSMISVGQELRVRPPDASSVPANASSGTTQPVIVPRIEARPIDSSAPAATSSVSAPVSAPISTPGNSDGIVAEPHGGRIPYSEKAWKDLQAQSMPQSEPKAASAPVVEKPVEAKPLPKPVASAPASAPDTSAKSGDDNVDWAWPSSGKLIATFNDSSNKGVDIGGSIGDPVLSAATGKVIYSGSDLRGYGNLVIIKHGTQFTTVYAHNKEILVKEGQTVQKGQKIAVMGDSDSDKPKLHFEVRKQGKPVDPLKFLPTR